MSNFLVAFLGSISVAVWFYTKQLRRSGGNTKSALIASAAVGALLFLVLFSLFSAIL
jgi:hypothetical protein